MSIEPQKLNEAVNALSPQQQAWVMEFISYIKRVDTATASPIVQAAETFMAKS